MRRIDLRHNCGIREPPTPADLDANQSVMELKILQAMRKEEEGGLSPVKKVYREKGAQEKQPETVWGMTDSESGALDEAFPKRDAVVREVRALSHVSADIVFGLLESILNGFSSRP